MRRAGLLALLALGFATADATAQAVAVPEFDDTSAWARDVSDLGTVFYFCLVPACTEGSTVSVSAGPEKLAPNLDEMVAMLPSMYVNMDIGVADLVVTAQTTAQVRNLAIGTYTFELFLTAAPNDIDPYWKSGFVFDSEAGQLVTIVSSSQSSIAAVANFDALLKQFVASR